MTENPEKLKALQLIEEGLKLRDQGFFKQVIGKWEEVIKIYRKLNMEKELADIAVELGNCYLSVGRESKAQEHYQIATSIYNRMEIPKNLRHISMKERQSEVPQEAAVLEETEFAQEIKPEMKSYALKIIVVGDPSVGKSSLIRRHADDTFESTYAPTIGTDFILKVVKLENMEITATLWDIGGHEEFVNIRHIYYEGADAAVIVYDVSREGTLKSVKKWYDDITKTVGNIPTLVIGNKIDLERKVKKETGEKLAGEMHAIFYETSAKTGENVNTAFGHLANLVYKI
ncbi:MAG: GTP-binding protein [Candidatus Helarchaeota archaeon]|nr:GTP-binding protein [Candidatus Helarchaeota archaeon]